MSAAPAVPAEPAGAGDGAAAPLIGAAAAPGAGAPLAAPAGESDVDGGDENEMPELESGSDDDSDGLWPLHHALPHDAHAPFAWPGPGPEPQQQLWHFAQLDGFIGQGAGLVIGGGQAIIIHGLHVRSLSRSVAPLWGRRLGTRG